MIGQLAWYPPPGLQWVDEFRYLGVQATRCTSEYVGCNHLPLLSLLKAKCQSWSRLLLNLIGRMNLVKMMILPQFNYIFRNCPVWVPNSFFKVDRCVDSFIWSGVSPCLAKAMLSLPPWLGGLALPNFQVYFWAAILVSVFFFVCVFRALGLMWLLAQRWLFWGPY